MNYYKKILNYLLSIGILVSINFCQDMSIDLILLNTGWFTYDSWSTVGNLWEINITNNTDEEKKYRIHFELKTDTNSELFFSGTTPIDSLGPGPNTQITLYSNNEIFKDPFYLDYWFCNETIDDVCKNNLEESIKNLGYFPPNDYSLKVQIIEADEDIEDPTDIIDEDEEILNFELGDQFEILYPDYGLTEEELGNNFFFQWKTPGFRNGVKIEFRIIISAIIPGDADSPEDAIDLGYNPVFYYDSDWDDLPIEQLWPYVESGSATELNFWYLTLISEKGINQLECGYDYAWRMDAREVIDGFETASGHQGLWGWSPEKISEVRKFTWGKNPEELVVSPVINDEVTDVLPLFTWDDNIGCAQDGFDIEISLIENEDFAESWGADFITSPFQYPSDAPGLIPGKSYKWRIRIHSFTGNTQWSEIETFTIQNIELIEPPIGQIIESVRPSFNINGPENISHYELLIGDENDEYVEQVEVYNREQEITTFPWQYPSDDIENGLFPNMAYYWKLLMFDGSGNILGDIEDYEVMGNFRVLPIILAEPANGETNIPLNQKFTWDGPLSVPSYNFLISGEQDPDVANPEFTIDGVTGKTIDYPENGDFPLENEKSYYWKIVPKDVNNNSGLPSSYSIVYQFTALDFPVIVVEYLMDKH